MGGFLLSLLGLGVLGVLVSIVKSDHDTGVAFIYDLIVLLVVITNIMQLLNSWRLI